LIGNPTKSKTKLGWEPKYDLAMLVEEMVAADVKLLQKDIHLVHGRHKILRQAE
jgi:GDPmannose 4,6-dehydratase